MADRTARTTDEATKLLKDAREVYVGAIIVPDSLNYVLITKREAAHLLKEIGSGRELTYTATLGPDGTLYLN